MLPSVQLNKLKAGVGVPPTQDFVGIAAILAPCQMGPSTPQGATKPTQALATYGYGMLTSLFAALQPQVNKQAVLLRVIPSTAGSYGTIVYTGTGTLGGGGFITGDMSVTPLDDFQGLAPGVAISFLTSGTTGTTGIQYQYSIDARDILDPAKVWSAPQQLGTALSITIPNTGVKFDLTTNKTVIGGLVGVGDYFTCPCTGPRLSATDVNTAVGILLAANLPFECIVVAGHDVTSTSLTDVDTALTAYQSRGRYRMFSMGANPKQGAAWDGVETEAAYLARMTTLSSALASINGCVAVDAAFMTDPQYGVDLVRSANWPFVIQLMSIGITTDAAEADLGPLPNGIRLYDENNNPVFHDEDATPGLDDQRFVTLRSWSNLIGAFITNPKAISNPGSQYVFAQYIRTMNVACTAGYGALVLLMSRGVNTDLQTGLIREDSARSIEQPVNDAINDVVGNLVQTAAFALSRDDAMPLTGATLTGTVAIVMPVYIKGFVVNAYFERTIVASTQPGFGA
jgi:hypothetical protein